MAAREAGEAYNEEDLDSDSTVDSSYVVVVVVVVVVCVLACSAAPCILVLATTRFADLGHRGCVAVCGAGIASGPRCPVCQALVIPTHHPLPTAKMLSPLPSRTWLVELMLSTMWCVCNNAHCMAAFPRLLRRWWLTVLYCWWCFSRCAGTWCGCHHGRTPCPRGWGDG